MNVSSERLTERPKWMQDTPTQTMTLVGRGRQFRYMQEEKAEMEDIR